MKKYLFVFIAFFSSFLAFPKSFDWDCQFGLGLGATFSRTRFSVADDFGCGDAEAGGASLDFLNFDFRIWEKKSSLSFMAHLEFGLYPSPHFEIGGVGLESKLSDSALSRFSALFGVGYDFALGEKFNIVASGVLGLQRLDFEGDFKRGAEETFEFSSCEFALGADVFAHCALGGRLGLFAAVTATVCPGGTSNVEFNESSTKPGSFFVSPRLGVAFRF
ncbi:MAG: hypothetical protein IKO57_09290 [Treponema sp.]|nr:hypothetical protein [Treponema sp.]